MGARHLKLGVVRRIVDRPARTERAVDPRITIRMPGDLQAWSPDPASKAGSVGVVSPGSIA